jgi:hypothetical protein
MVPALLLIACMVLLVFLLGLPLLLRPDSPVPDIVALGLLAVIVLAFAWGTGAWWILLPILALAALLAWLDRRDETALRDAGPDGGEERSRRTLSRFRLWRAAHHVQFALIVSVFVLPAVGAGKAIGTAIVPCMVIALAMGALFRFAFVRSCRRDERAAPRANWPG